MQTTFDKLGGTYCQEGDYLLPNIEVLAVFLRHSNQESTHTGTAAITSKMECCFRNTVEKQVNSISMEIAAHLPGERRPLVRIAVSQTAIAPMACSDGKTLVLVSAL